MAQWSTTAAATTSGLADDALSRVLIALMKGIVERDSDQALWQALLALDGRVRDHCAVLGLEPMIYDEEGYAYLRQRPPREGEAELPRLVQRRPLSYPVSLLLVLFRRRLAELDAGGGDTRLILTLEEMTEMLRLFLAGTENEARLADRIGAHVRRIVDLGFLRPLKGRADAYEVSRLIKAFVDGQWLAGFAERLAAYRAHAAANANEKDVADADA